MPTFIFVAYIMEALFSIDQREAGLAETLNELTNGRCVWACSGSCRTHVGFYMASGFMLRELISLPLTHDLCHGSPS